MKPLDPRLLHHLRPARLPLGGLVVAGTVSGLLLVGQAFAVAGLLTAAVQGHPLGGWALALAAVVTGRALASWLVDVCAARASGLVGTALRARLVGTALRRGPAWLSGRRDGELALLATRGVAAVEPYLTRYLPALVLAGVLPAATVLAIGSQDLLSGVVVLATLPLLPVFAILVGLATRDRADRQWRLLAALSGHFVDVVRGLPTLVAHRRARAQSARIREITQRYRQATADTLRLAFASSAVLELVATLSVALVAVVVGLRLAAGSLDLRTALVVLLLAPEAYWPVRRVGAEFHAAAEGTATFEAVDALLADDDPDPAAGTHPVPDGELVLDGVSVTYPGRTEPALAPLSATVPARGLTAVVGPSGAGKSTLLAALMGLVPLSTGGLRVAGERVDPADEAWRSRVAWIPQRPWLLAGTVRDNVRLGRPGASDADVWLALEQVDLAEHVATLPDGLDSEVGEDGLGFSAGERARLALARAVVADRPWVLLDEPTAHLDPATESAVARTLVRLAETRAVLVVAHRESLVTLADHVVAVAPAAVPATPAPAVVRREGRADSSGLPRPAADPADEVPGRRKGGAGLGIALGALAASAGVALTATAGWLIVQASTHPPVLTLMVAIVGVRAFGLARPVLRYAERLVSHDVALDALAQRRAEVYDALVPLVPGRLGGHGRRRGDVLTGVVDDVDALVDRQLRVRAPLWTAGLVLPGAVALSWLALPSAATVVALATLPAALAGFALSRAGARRAEPAFVTARSALSAEVTATLEGAADLLMWQRTGHAVDRVSRVSAQVARAAGRSARATALGRAQAVLLAGAGVAGVLAVGAAPLAAGEVSAPMLALLALLPLALLDVVLPLADAGALAVRTAAAERRLERLRTTAPTVTDPVSPAVPTGEHDLAVHGVSAGWADAPVLRDLSFELRPGGRLGVVGPSGCGKSTLVALLLRFLDPATGAVRLGGADLCDLRPDDVRREVGLLDDDPHVFASTLVENVRLARPDATDAEVERALRVARLGDWLDALPQGLHTPLGDGHAAVSGGERARIGMARAVLADAPVLVLDEPTAHLDSATARAVADDLLAEDGRTVVWVTHGRAGLDRMHAVLDLGAGVLHETAGSPVAG